LKPKYVIIIPDGSADEPLDELEGKTPLEAAKTPNMDKISLTGRQGMVYTVPEGMSPGSDVAQMSLLGYDPLEFYTGRAPIEAAARGIELGAKDWIFRCTLVTVSDGKMADHSAGHISTAEGTELIRTVDEKLGNENIEFHPGISYRHLTVFRDCDFKVKTYPPHDFIGTSIDKILPRGKGADILIDIMAESQELFSRHEINKVKKDLDENEVSSVWLWGEGKKTVMPAFSKRFNLKGATIAAVDLVRGLSKLIGFDLIEVEGATGFTDTNYEGKGQAAIKTLENYDLVFVHVEAPDEASHAGNLGLKTEAIEQIDKYVVGPVYQSLQKYDNWRIMVAPDHPTPLNTRAHSDNPVPFAMAGTGVSGILNNKFGEKNADKSGLNIEKGCELMEYFLRS
jgi:2,3-bisphosphoglycerate-independent phosphoglycerate mutase